MLCQMLEADVPMVIPHDTDLPAVIHDLACQAITVCHSGKKAKHYQCLTTLCNSTIRWNTVQLQSFVMMLFFAYAIILTVSDLLLDCLELCKCTRIAMDVYHQCQLSDNYGFIAKVTIAFLSFLE